MMKTCVVLNGNIINIGEWDYQIQPFELSPAVLDEEGNVVTEAVYEDRATNPLPVGAVLEERDFEYDSERGWYEVGTSAPSSPQDRITELEQTVADLIAVMVEKGITP